MNEKTQCSGIVSGEGNFGWYHPHGCKKTAIVEREGKWYCKIHDPEYIKAQSDKRWAEYEARSKARQRGWELEAARQAAVKGLSLEELQALKPERVKASNELYEALKKLVDYYDNWQAVHYQYLSEAHDILEKLDGLKI